MGKFAIECPKCKSINQASTFLFAKKVIKCGSCGEEIDVKASRLTSKVCPGCGNVIVCDQAKLKDKKCPICGKELSAMTATAEYKIITVNCPQCSCAIEVDKTKTTATCPICDCEFDVQKEIAKEKLQSNTGISVIQYEGDNSTFIWKYPNENFNMGSQLIVHSSQDAIFFLDGAALDTFGPGRYTLETQNIPLLKGVHNLSDDSRGAFHSEVYFINKTTQMGIKWGTDSRVRFIDPLTGIPLDIGASGEMNLQVADSRKLLLKLVGTMKGINWDSDASGFSRSLKACFRAPIVAEVKTYLASVIKEKKINIFEIDSYMSSLSEALKEKISPKLEEYGLIIPEFYITTISLPEEDKNFKDIRTLISQAYIGVRAEEVRTDIAKAEQQRKLVEAQTQAQLEMIKAQGSAEALRMTGMAEAEVMRAKGYSHKDEIEADVQKAYASGIGRFGANSASSTGGGVSSDMVNLLMGMKVAGIMGDKLEGAMNNTNHAVSPTTDSAPLAEIWDCSCGKKNIIGKFCPECGKAKPDKASWDCANCGAKGITSKFCPECGTPKPEKTSWDCPNCGIKDITSKFCPECGTSKTEKATWDCSNCGTKGITSKFCPDCGKTKPE